MMIGFPAGVRVYLAVEPHDMRKPFNGLGAIARELDARALEDGVMFAFTSELVPFPEPGPGRFKL